jgi:hypothetical protein
MQASSPEKRRSNRPLTQFALGCLDLFLKTSNYSTDRSRGDTSVLCTKKDKIKKFKAFVFGEQIIEVTLFEDEPVAVNVFMGSTFGANGGPSDPVVERLNGLLDALGSYSVIPRGVRVFRDRIEEIFYLGRGEQKVPVGLLYAHKVSIKPNFEELEMTPDVEVIDG